MTGSAPSDVPLSSPGEEHSVCLDPASQRRGRKKKGIGLLKRHHVCWIMPGKGKCCLPFPCCSLARLSKGRPPVLHVITSRISGARGKSLITHHMFCDIWMQFFCWVLLDPKGCAHDTRHCFVFGGQQHARTGPLLLQNSGPQCPQE